MEGCRLALLRSRIMCRFSKSGEVHSYSSRRLCGLEIKCFAAQQHIGFLSVGPFHCHGIQRPYSSSSSNKIERSKIGEGIDSKQKDPQLNLQESGSTGASQDTEKNLSVFQRFKQTYKEHGKVLIVVEVVTSIFWYGLFYTIVSCGVDVISLMEQMGFSETLIQPFRSSSLGDFVIAFLLYKLISPIRYAVTLAGTGYIIRWMRKSGKIPPVTQNTKLSTLYRDSREEIRTRKAKFKETRRSRNKVKGKKKRGQK